MLTSRPNRAGIEGAESLIRHRIRETPVLDVEPEAFGAACNSLSFKLELLQHTGSFKPRGAFVNLMIQPPRLPGVVAASGGNHGAAVAYAARSLGLAAHIFVPAIASPAKLARIRGYGANLVIAGESYAEALAASEAFLKEEGGLPVHAYNSPATLLGQGTVALEFARQRPDLDTVLVAVGGGGLIGGMACYWGRDVKLVGVETEGCPTLKRALEAGAPVDVGVGGVAADSLGARRIGALAFAALQEAGIESVLVTDEAVTKTQRLLWDACRVVAEPGGAAAAAALMSRRYVPAPDERVGVVLCGANTTAVDWG